MYSCSWSDILTSTKLSIVLLLAVCSLFINTTRRRLFEGSFSTGIPTVGFSHSILSFWDIIRFWKDAAGMLKEGHTKFPGHAFQLPHADRWVVYVTDPKLVEEVSSFPGSHLSLMEASNDLLQVQLTGLYQDQQVTNLIRSRLTRDLGNKLVPAISNTASSFISLSLKDAQDRWLPLPAFDFMSKCSSRITARIFLGISRVDDEEYLQLSEDWAHGVLTVSSTLNAAPAFCRRTLNWLFNPLPNILRLAEANLVPLIHQRLSIIRARGGARDVEDDFLDEILRLKRVDPLDTFLTTKRLLSASFAAIHTTSTSLTFALFYLASRPDIVPTLRKEIISCMEDDQWSKESLQNMVNLDSFLRESMRLSSVSAAGIIRKTVQPVTLSDGSYIREGILLLASPLPIHTDQSIYANAESFNPLRFYQPGDEKPQGSLVSTSLNYFPFGYGPHSCPGRFIASAIMKLTMAHLIINYDIKLEQSERPKDRWMGILCYPDPSIRVLFRRCEEPFLSY